MSKHKLKLVTSIGCVSLAISATALYFSQRGDCPIAFCKPLFLETVARGLPQSQTSTAKLRLQAQAITVKVMSKEFLGSGILWQQQNSIYTVITNAHVLRAGEAPYKIQTPDGQIYAASSPKNLNFGKNDLAILQFRSPKKTYTVSSIGSQPVVGDEVFASGFYAQADEEQQRYSLTTGKVSLVLPKSLAGG